MNTPDDEMDKALESDRQKLEDLGADPGPRYGDIFGPTNTSEFAEWLRETLAVVEQQRNHDEWDCGYIAALRMVRDRLTSLASSHDLPSVKG